MVEAWGERQSLGRWGGAKWKRLKTFIAMLCEALGTSYGDIPILVVPTALLRRRTPLLRKHDMRFLEAI